MSASNTPPGTNPPPPSYSIPSNPNSLRGKFLYEVQLRLGYPKIDILELSPEHYEFALNRALLRYRQKSTNAVE